jgi:predicted phosphoribosyltransferase
MARRHITAGSSPTAVRRFRNRGEAGRALARALRRYAGHPDVLVLALPRGGVPVAYEVARHLGCPLDLLLVRKLGVPGWEELALGAIADGGVRVLNHDVVEHLAIAPETIDAVAAVEQAELERRARAYRGDRPPPDLRGKTVILIDDGLVTGATIQAAVMAARAQHPRRLVVAVPLASRDSLHALRPLVDDLVWVLAPEPFYALGLWYEDFRPTTDDEVRRLLGQAAAPLEARA